MLGPLFRFLQKQVGRPWDAVYSEIARNLPKTSLQNRHIYTHVWEFVETNVIPFRIVLEASVLGKKREGYRSGGAVTLFLDDDFRLPLHILVVFVIELFSVNEHDHVCILFNGAGFAKVRHLRLSPGAIFDLAIKLR